MKEAPGSSETSVLTRATRRNNPEDTILQLLESSHSAKTIMQKSVIPVPTFFSYLHKDEQS
jgi:hypothetical protein